MTIQPRSSPSNSGADSNIANLKMDGKLKNDGDYKKSAQVNEPTFQGSKTSIVYAQAKHDLEEGNFNAALAGIEVELTKILEAVGHDELHPALAPLYYLYGTTLLYSVEESSQDTMAMTTVQAQADETDEAELVPVELVNDNVEVEDEDADEAATINVSTPDTPPAIPVDTSAEDLQVAWENLEMSRSILDRLLDPCTAGGSDYSSLSFEEIEMARDLAQVHLRLGDLQKSNGNYQSAADDYERCRNILENIAEDSIIIPEGSSGKVYADRKVANVHYSLAMTYMLLAAEGEKELQKKQDSPEAPLDNPILAAVAAAAKEVAQDDAPCMTPAEITHCRELSIQHYLDTGKCFTALMANLCGETPFFGSANNQEETSSVSASAGFSSSSLTNLIAGASKQMSSIRDCVSSWEALLDNEQDAVLEWKELLDEIQETIDNAESEAQVLRDNINQLTSNVEKQVQEEDAKTGATTSNGFDAPSSQAAVANAPMLVVKKKRRPTESLKPAESAKKLKETE